MPHYSFPLSPLQSVVLVLYPETPVRSFKSREVSSYSLTVSYVQLLIVLRREQIFREREYTYYKKTLFTIVGITHESIIRLCPQTSSHLQKCPTFPPSSQPFFTHLDSLDYQLIYLIPFATLSFIITVDVSTPFSLHKFHLFDRLEREIQKREDLSLGYNK